jgi:hypothetical protein
VTSGIAASTPLAFTQFRGQVVVDQDPGMPYVFVSEGTPGTQIAMLGFDGALETTIGGLTAPSGMVIVGSTLYVAQCDSAAGIAKYTIGAGTLTPAGAIALGTDSATGQPMKTGCSLALGGGRLWFVDAESDGFLYSVDLAGTAVDTSSNVVLFDNVTSDPGAPNNIFDVVGTNVLRLDVSSPTATTAATATGAFGYSLHQLVPSPSGTRLYMAAESSQSVSAWDTSTMTKLANYTAGFHGADAVAVNATGGVLAVGAVDWTPDISVYRAGTSKPSRTYTIGGTSSHPGWAGLAFSPDSTKLFAVTTDLGSAGNVTFRVLSKPLSIAPILTVRAPTVRYGRVAHVTAHLSAHGTNRRVVIWRHPYGGSWSVLAAGNVGPTGNFVASYKPARRTTLYATYGGGGKYLAVKSGLWQENVRALEGIALSGFYAKSGAYHLYHAGTHPGVRGAVAPNHHGQCIYFEIEHFGAGHWTAPARSGCFHLNSSSAALVVYTGPFARGVAYRQHIYFPGDIDHVGGYSVWVYMKAV